MAQRLLRRLCKACKEPYTPSREDLPHDFPWDQLNGQPLYRPVGCRQCETKGSRGRTPVLEILVMDTDMDELVATRATAKELRTGLAAMDEALEIADKYAATGEI